MGLEVSSDERGAALGRSRNCYLVLLRVVAIAANVVGQWLATGMAISTGIWKARRSVSCAGRSR